MNVPQLLFIVVVNEKMREEGTMVVFLNIIEKLLLSLFIIITLLNFPKIQQQSVH